MRLTILICGLAVSMFTAPPVPAEGPARTKEGGQADADAIRTLYDTHQAAFEGIYGGISVAETSIQGTLARCDADLAKIENLETTVFPEVQPMMVRVTETWGDLGGDVEWNMKQAGVENLDSVSTRFEDWKRMLDAVARTRAANAQYLADMVQSVYGDIDFFVEDIRVKKLEEAKSLLEWALRFDATNEYANARLAGIDAEIDALAERLEAEMDARTWAGNSDGFEGPGSAAELSKVALAYFRADRDWGGNENGTEVLAVCVRGGWQPADRDIFGRIVSWRLPIHVAVTKPDYREKNIARVYELSAVAEEGAPGAAKKAPPFAGYWVGDSWNMRLSNLPK